MALRNVVCFPQRKAGRKMEDGKDEATNARQTTRSRETKFGVFGNSDSLFIQRFI